MITLDDLNKLADRAVNESPPAHLAEYCREHFVIYHHFIYLLAAKLNPCVMVELGVCEGRGSVSAAMSRDVRVVGIDKVKRDSIDDLLKMYPNFTFVHQLSLPVPDCVKTCVSNGIDILYIDTDHYYEIVHNEFMAYKPYLNNGAVVLFDDLSHDDNGVLRAFEELPYEKIQRDDLHPGCGYGIMIYKRDNE